MKICVYAISKNEIKFVDRWYDSMKEADYVCCLDTGSTDGTFERLKELGVITDQKVISPWRFDVARNESMKLIPNDADICVCTDLDELLTPGWADAVKKQWKPEATRGKYKYVWRYTDDGKEDTVFDYEKIHCRDGFKWINPVHEVLQYDKENEIYVYIKGITLQHYPDKEKSRAQYLKLLELGVQEDPHNDRNAHYLGREYMFHREFEKAIKMLKHHLEMPEATWDAERAASMRFLGRCYENLRDLSEAESWFLKAIFEAPRYREVWYEAAAFYYRNNKWSQCLFACSEAMKRTERLRSYISEPDAWSSLLPDIGSVAAANMQQYPLAKKWMKEALRLDPNNERIKNNLRALG